MSPVNSVVLATLSAIEYLSWAPRAAEPFFRSPVESRFVRVLKSIFIVPAMTSSSVSGSDWPSALDADADATSNVSTRQTIARFAFFMWFSLAKQGLDAGNYIYRPANLATFGPPANYNCRSVYNGCPPCGIGCGGCWKSIRRRRSPWLQSGRDRKSTR